MGLTLWPVLWVGTGWVYLFFAIHFVWVPMGSSVFTVGSSWSFLGSSCLSQYLQWVPAGFLMGSLCFAIVCWWVPRGFVVGSAGLRGYLQWVPAGFLMGSLRFPIISWRVPRGFAVGSAGLCRYLQRILFLLTKKGLFS